MSILPPHRGRAARCCSSAVWRAHHAQDAWERAQGNLGAGREFRHFLVHVQIKILHLLVLEFLGEFTEHVGDVEVGAVGARHDLN
jgi:hypothetical protein